MMKARSYQGLQDLNAMLDLLSAGHKANNGTYYVHRGDLQWWLFYTDVPREMWQSNIHLWKYADQLIGWTLLSPEMNAFDVFTVPELRGDAREDEMLTCAVEELSALDEIQNIWVAEEDDIRTAWFEEHGFTVDEHSSIYFTRSLAD